MINIKELSMDELIETIRECQIEMDQRKTEERNSAIEAFKQAWYTLTDKCGIEIWGPDGQLFFGDLEFC